jgi:hypothetical protein
LKEKQKHEKGIIKSTNFFFLSLLLLSLLFLYPFPHINLDFFFVSSPLIAVLPRENAQGKNEILFISSLTSSQSLSIL